MSVSALDDKWPLRRLPPAGSPISLGDLARAAWRVARWSDVRTQFAVRLAEAYDAVSVELCASGTDALTRALSVAGALTGGARIVALPAYACYDLASAAVGSGSHVVFYDLDPHTLGPDLDSVRQTLSDGASAVVSAPLYGIPVEWQPLADLVTAAGAALVEDAAQGHGSTWRGRPLGSLGTLSVLSFGRGKGWTGGAGGALLRRRQVTQLPERSQRHAAPLPSSIALEFSVFIRAVFQWALGRPRLYPIPAAMPWLHLGETVYHEPLPPREMTAIAAALLDCTVLSADREDDHRRQVAHYYLERLPFGDNLRQVSLPLESVGGYCRFPFLASGELRAAASSRRALRLGVSPGYPALLPTVAALNDWIVVRRRYAGAAQLQHELFTAPTHRWVEPQDAEAIVSLLSQPHSRSRSLRTDTGLEENSLLLNARVPTHNGC